MPVKTSIHAEKFSKLISKRIKLFKEQNPTENPWDWLMALINRLAQNHEPIVDVDTDDFSSTVISMYNELQPFQYFVEPIGEEEIVTMTT